MTIVLTVPGLGGSSPTHWQSRWEALYPECRQVELSNWNIPERGEWLEGLDTAIRACETPPVVVTHSLSCALLAHWASRHRSVPLKGALMVAPTDVDNRDTLPAEALCFGPMPLGILPFPTVVVSSSNDPYVTEQRAKVFATAWGAGFYNVGPAGHINADSHLDQWDTGWALVQELSAAAHSAANQQA